MAMRIYAGVGDRGFDPFTTWSKRWEYYNDTTGPAEDLKCWQEVQGSPPDRTGINKIFKIARENGWVPRLRETAPSSADEIIFTADAARNEVQLLVRDFLERRVACPESERDAWIDVYFEQRDPDWPSVKAMLVPTGVGKTRITIQELAAWIREVTIKGPIIYAVPQHKLSAEIENQFAAKTPCAGVLSCRRARCFYTAR